MIEFVNLNQKEIKHAISEALKSLKDSEQPVVIRDGLQLMSLEEWRSFLVCQCGFAEDRRHFGFDETMVEADWWEVSYQPDKASSYAYSNTRQPLHTDNAWFDDAAEVNFFAMMKQASSGGSQTVYPLSRIIDDLQTQHPALFDQLTSVPVVIKKGAGEEQNKTTIIKLSEQGQSIHWNYYRTQREDPIVADMCDAFFRFLEKQESTNSVYRLHCNTGDCFAFNDAKLLHGRDAFTANEPYDRVLRQSMWAIPAV